MMAVKMAFVMMALHQERRISMKKAFRPDGGP